MDYTPKFSKIVKVTAKDFYATGSEKGASGFFVSGSGGAGDVRDPEAASEGVSSTTGTAQFNRTRLHWLG